MKKTNFDDDSKRVLKLYYYDGNNNEVVLRELKSLKKIKEGVNYYLNNVKSDMTSLFVDDDLDNNIFSAFLTDDSWDIEEDNFDYYEDYIYPPDDYKNTLLNKVYYSLVGAPENIKSKAPNLYSDIIKPDKDSMTIDEVGDTNDSIGYYWDKENAVINIGIENENNVRKVNTINKVCEKFNLILKRFGSSNFSIVVPNQLKYYL